MQNKMIHSCSALDFACRTGLYRAAAFFENPEVRAQYSASFQLNVGLSSRVLDFFLKCTGLSSQIFGYFLKEFRTEIKDCVEFREKPEKCREI